MNVDTLLKNILDEPDSYSKTILSKKEYNTLLSLFSSLSSPIYITESQGRLILKILKENCSKLAKFSQDIDMSVHSPQWAKVFRQVEQIRKMFLSSADDGKMIINIEFTFSSQIRKVLQDNSKNCENLELVGSGKKYHADLTEHNIVFLVDLLKSFKFEIEDTILNHYNVIKSWSENQVQDQFLISNIDNTNFHRHITADLGIETAIDQNIIMDRSMRYQYHTEIARKFGENLTEIIAYREKTRVWINKTEHNVSDIIRSLIQLRRLPLLVVFDTIANTKYLENLEILSFALEENGIHDKVGIYFRLPNDDIGKKFNTFIAERQYNYNLASDTQVAGVMSGKLPKFFIKNAWKPMSILTLDTRMGLRHGKTSVYANCCDCIIEWSDEPTMFENRIIQTWR
jgi:hypothetical protein